MSKSNDDQPSLGRDRARLINDRLIDLFRVRAKAERARHIRGEVPLEHQLALFNQIQDTYLVLRPLRDEAAIEDWWETVTLSERWGDWAMPVDPEEHDDAFPVAQTDEGVVYARFAPYQGLETIDQLRDVITERTEKTAVFGGIREKTTREPDLPAYDILRDISMRLDEAADKLGFAPSVKQKPARPEENPVDPGGRFYE